MKDQDQQQEDIKTDLKHDTMEFSAATDGDDQLDLDDTTKDDDGISGEELDALEEDGEDDLDAALDAVEEDRLDDADNLPEESDEDDYYDDDAAPEVSWMAEFKTSKNILWKTSPILKLLCLRQNL